MSTCQQHFTYIDSGSFLDVDTIKQTILLTYRDDFSKYGKRVNQTLLKSVFQKLPSFVGKKIKYVNFDRYEKTVNIKKVLHQLELAKIYYPVCHSAANGIPLRAESNEKDKKPLFLDVGLFNKRVDATTRISMRQMKLPWLIPVR